LNCDSGIHFIHGPNAQGKTSILESIYLLSNLKSFRDSDVGAMVKVGTTHAQVKGNFLIDQTSQAELRVDLVQTPLRSGGNRLEKRAHINQKLMKSAADYYGLKLNHFPIQFHAINLNPTSTDLMRGEPSIRRNYLNQVISSENPGYMGVLKRYQKTLDQKNALLKAEEKFNANLLAILNDSLVKEGAQIVFSRLFYLQKIAPAVLDFLSNIAPKQEPINMGYRTGETLYFTGQFELPSLQNLEGILHQKLAQNSTQERVRRTSLVGPHRDDLIFRVGNQVNLAEMAKDLVDVGSQGEIRSVLLALKLSELEEFKKHTGVQPVLLIDDFSSELDSTRRGFLLNYLKDSELQIFVTSTDDPSSVLSNSLEFGKGKSIRISNGTIQSE
jgi:DNA replication and repair protein RecF